jgi:5-methylcytosine-specific restriction endonuclease McrA
MAYKDPEKQRAYKAEYRRLNRARINAYANRWAAAKRARRTPEELAKAAAGIERDRQRKRQMHEDAVARRVERKALSREVRIRALRAKLPKRLEEKREARRRAKHVRRARKRGADVGLTVGRKRQLLVLQKGRCAACRSGGVELTLDHIVPLALGGSHTDDNVQLLCRSCNSRKSAKPPEVFMQSMGFLL